MRKIKETLEMRRETISGQIDKLEALRPQIEELGVDLHYYDHSTPMSILIVAGTMCFFLAIAIGLYVYLQSLWSMKYMPLYLVALSCLLISVTIYIVTKKHGSVYLLASKFNIDDLEHQLKCYEDLIDGHKQHRKDLELYQPKFEHLIPIITNELNGTYVAFYDNDWLLKARICFGDYENEDYDFNEEDYVRLVLRIVESLYKNKTDDMLMRFVHEFEDSL